MVEELEELEQKLRNKKQEKLRKKRRKRDLRSRNTQTCDNETPGDATKLAKVWGQIKAEIDKSDIGQVAKISYLKKLLVLRVRAVIDGLPFNTGGYTRAKTFS